MNDKNKVIPIRNDGQEEQDLLTKRRAQIADMTNRLSRSRTAMMLHLNALANHPTDIAQITGHSFDLIAGCADEALLAHKVLAEVIIDIVPHQILIDEFLRSIETVRQQEVDHATS